MDLDSGSLDPPPVGERRVLLWGNTLEECCMYFMGSRDYNYWVTDDLRSQLSPAIINEILYHLSSNFLYNESNMF